MADRDLLALQAMMARLDPEEKATLERPQPGVTARDVRRYLTDLPKLWRDTDPGGRRGIAEAAFDRIDAIGLDLVLHPSAEAERFGWSEAFGSEPLVYSIGRSGRGERTSPDGTYLIDPLRQARPRAQAAASTTRPGTR